MSQSPNHPITQSPNLLLGGILLAYLCLATLFAVTTPAWQNPDEPAHYNYIAHIAQERSLPVLQMGDYDEAHLQRLRDEGFPPHLSIEPVRYEAHQPPLYYLSAVPIFWLTDGSLLTLRLYSVLLGLGSVLGVHAVARLLFPRHPWIHLSATAFAAFLPMQLAIFAAVNNDTLAALIIVWSMAVLVRWVLGIGDRGLGTGDWGLGTGSGSITHSPNLPISQSPNLPIPQSPNHLVPLSILIGLGLVTKATAYILLPVAVLTVAGVTLWQAITTPRPNPQPSPPNPQSLIPNIQSTAKHLLTRLAALVLPALLIGLPLWLRNISVYGGMDFLGLAWHDLVVTGQPTTAAWIEANGWAAYGERAWRFTFSSFWGVFGWMGVFMDARIYTLLQAFSLAGLLGFLAWAVDAWRARSLSPSQMWAGISLLLLLGGTFAAYVWYNLGFIQHQGRYLFPALVTFSLIFALGWSHLLRAKAGYWVGMILVGVGLGIGGISAAGGDLDSWSLLLWAGLGGALMVNRFLARWPVWSRMGPILQMAPFLFLGLLDALIPFLYSIPQLQSP